MLPPTPAPAQGKPAPPLTCERLRAAPAVFALVTGLTPDEFDALLADLRPRYEAAEDARLARPGRKNARGAGHPFALPLPDRVLVALLRLRYRAVDWFVAFLLGVSELTAWRTRRRLVPLLRECRHTELALRRRRLTRRLAYRAARQVPELRIFLNSFPAWARGPEPPSTAGADDGQATAEAPRHSSIGPDGGHGAAGRPAAEPQPLAADPHRHQPAAPGEGDEVSQPPSLSGPRSM